MPTLREREKDRDILFPMFNVRFETLLRKESTGISDQALQVLRDHDWPGNVRELEHVLERACVLCDTTTITSDHLPLELQEKERPARPLQPAEKLLEEENEEVRIINTLSRTFGNKAQAARLLGIDRSTLYRKLKLYNIDPDAVVAS